MRLASVAVAPLESPPILPEAGRPGPPGAATRGYTPGPPGRFQKVAERAVPDSASMNTRLTSG